MNERMYLVKIAGQYVVLTTKFYFKNNFEKIWKKGKEFLSLLHRNDYLSTFKNSREL